MLRDGAAAGNPWSGWAEPEVVLLPILVLLTAIALTVWLQSPLPITVYTVGVVGLALWNERAYWREYVDMYRSIRPRHVAVALPTVVVVLGIAFLVIEYAPLDLLRWSWLMEAGEETGTNTLALPFQFGLFAPVWALMILAALPLHALVEERLFRRGTRTAVDVVWRSLVFGLAHTVAGVPLGVALLALSVGGVVFSLEYLRALKVLGGTHLAPDAWRHNDDANDLEEHAIKASGVLHLTYNLLVLLVVSTLLALSAFAPELIPF